GQPHLADAAPDRPCDRCAVAGSGGVSGPPRVARRRRPAPSAPVRRGQKHGVSGPPPTGTGSGPLGPLPARPALGPGAASAGEAALRAPDPGPRPVQLLRERTVGPPFGDRLLEVRPAVAAVDAVVGECDERAVGGAHRSTSGTRRCSLMQSGQAW